MEQVSFSGSDPRQVQDRILEQKLRSAEKAATQKGSDEEMRQVSRDLEAVFLRLLIDSMQKTIPESSLFGQSSGMETFQGMFNENVAEQMSRNGSIGLADMIYRQLSRNGNEAVADSPSAQAGSTVRASTPRPAPAAATEQTIINPAANENCIPDSLSSFRDLITRSASRHGLDPALVSAVIMQESGGDPRAVSPAGARGLMQLMPSTADSLGVADSFDPEQNVEGGTRYLSRMLERFGGDEKLALAAYNAGPGAVARYGGTPPYRETRAYIQRVLALKQSITDSTGI